MLKPRFTSEHWEIVSGQLLAEERWRIARKDAVYGKMKWLIEHYYPNGISDYNMKTYLPDLDINHKDSKGRRLLFQAAAEGDEAVVKWLIETKADIALQGKRGVKPITALCCAKENKHSKIVDMLKKAGAIDYDEFVQAAREGDEEKVAAFIQAGVDVQFLNNVGDTALDLAKEACVSGIAFSLAKNSWTRLDLAKCTRIVEMLEKAGAIHYKEFRQAAEQGNEEKVAAFLQAGADPMKNGYYTHHYSGSAVHYARDNGHTRILEMFKEAGAVWDEHGM